MSWNANLYWQLGGAGSNFHMRHQKDYGMENTCTSIFYALTNSIAGKPDPDEDKYRFGIELVLGVLDSGASFVLLSNAQKDRVFQATYGNLSITGRPRHPHDYMSLSPIRFPTLEALISKIDLYKEKGKKKLGQSQSNSKANKAYSGSTAGSYRPEFELNRVLFRVLSRSSISPETFSLPHDVFATTKRASAISIAVNVWGEAVSSSVGMDRGPDLLDVAWVEVPLEVIYGDHRGKEKSASHVIVQENRLLRIVGGNLIPSDDMPSSTQKRDVMLRNLKSFWEKASSGSSSIFLIVQDKKAVLNIMNKAGIETHNFIEGIRKYLSPSATPNSEPSHSYRSHSRHDNYDNYSTGFKLKRHSRSPSPIRRNDTVGNHIKRRRSSPAPSQSVFIVEIDKLYGALDVIVRKLAPNTRAIARKVGVVVKADSIVCAGDDCHTILDCWRSMASGLSIDEQKDQRGMNGMEIKPEYADMKIAAATPRAPHETLSNESDDEYDPNDVPTNSRSSGTTAYTSEENVPCISGYNDANDDDDPYEDVW